MDIISRDPNVSNSNRLQNVDIFRFFFTNFERYVSQIPRNQLLIFPVNLELEQVISQTQLVHLWLEIGRSVGLVLLVYGLKGLSSKTNYCTDRSTFLLRNTYFNKILRSSSNLTNDTFGECGSQGIDVEAARVDLLGGRKKKRGRSNGGLPPRPAQGGWGFIMQEERRVGSRGIFQCGCQSLVSEHMDMPLLDFNLESSVRRPLIPHQRK